MDSPFARPIARRTPLFSASAFTIALLFAVLFSASAQAQAPVHQSLNQLSTDKFTNTSSQHATEVEPDTYSYGSTIVSAFQVGRFTDGGCSDIGFATSSDGGATWTNGVLPGITNIQGAGNPYDRISDPSVAYDAAHGEWIIASLPIVDSFKQIPAVVVSRSTDGIHWGNPVSVTGNVSSSDKNWIVCDDSSSSPYFGHCYVEWDNPNTGDTIFMATSADGGLTWGPALKTGNSATGIGGQPLVQPNGTVVVPIEAGFGNAISSFTSTNGGTSWSKTVQVATISSHLDAGGIRSGPLPSAEVDGAGTIYVAWEDCRFRAKCAENDIVLSTSTDGLTWSSVARVPIDPVSSTVDHFIPGIAVDKNTSGASAHIGITYYFYTKSSCSVSTCVLGVGYIGSPDGGASWSPSINLAGPMSLNSLPQTTNGLMVGDYISTSFAEGLAHGVFALAKPKLGATFNESMVTSKAGLPAFPSGPLTPVGHEKPVPHFHSDHPLPSAPLRDNPPPSARIHP